MRMRALVLALLAAGPAFAQEPPPPPQPAYPSESEDCCDDPGANCCEPRPIPPPPLPPPGGPPVIILPPLYVPAPASYVPPPKKRSDDKFLAKLSLGGAYQHFFGESVGGAALELQLGAEDKVWGMAAQIGLTIGQMTGGLSYEWFRFGPGVEFQLGQRWRLGFGLTVGALVIQRASGDSSEDMTSPSLGAHLDLSVDLVRGAHRNALYASARLGGDVILDVTDLSNWAALLSVGLGYRF